ncbi:MAG: heavy metal translocating P-type ATPase [Clostridia bacterium]|nr:heavy metal translocating P-type ATPase [Clostridia bacterium]
MKKKFRLLNMHCAGCANALEGKIAEIEGVKMAQINYATKILTLEVENENHEKIIEDVLSGIKRFDRMVKVEDPSFDVSEKEKRARLLKILFICLSAVFLMAGLLVEHLSGIFWLYLSLYIVSYLLVAHQIIYASVINVTGGNVFDENFLMTVATIGAFAISKYSEAVMVVLLYQIGTLLENLATTRSKNAINSLLSIKVQEACVVTDEGDITIPTSKVKKGALIRVKPGESVPLDGVVVIGSSFVNTALVTGESAERSITIGDEILSGFINIDGVLTIRTTTEEKDSTVSRIVDMVETATTKKAGTEKFISKFAKIYTPVVCIIAVLIAVVPCLFVGFSSFSEYLYRGLVFLVVSCPCALVISIPLTFFAGLGASARQGVLIKGSNFVELLSKTSAVIFDKTGTLTEGEFEVEEIKTYGEQSTDEVLEFVAYAENYSNHRIAKSIVKKYLESNTINGDWISDVSEHAGLGISATIFMIPALVGSANLLINNGIEIKEQIVGKTAVYLAVNGEHVGTVIMEDRLKEDSFEAVKCLKEIGIKEVSMLTGDNEAVASEVSGALGLDSFHAGLLPEDKVMMLNNYRSNNTKIAYVGDGINDAPILAEVDVGISMGLSSNDIATEASDVVLMTDEPSKVVDAILIARKTHKIVLENIIFTLLVKLAVLALSALGITGMWLAIFADVGVSIIAVLNSLRALSSIKRKEPKCCSVPLKATKQAG